MATNYPGSLDTWNNPTSTTNMNDTGYYHDEAHSNLNDAVEAIEGELGTDPAGVYPTVKARLLQPINGIYPSVRTTLTGVDYVTYDPLICALNYALVAQRVVYQRWYCPESFSATKLWWVHTSASSTVTTAEVGIYDSSGTKLQSADAASVVTSVGLKSVTITSQSVTAGSTYYFAIMVDATSMGGIAAFTSVDSDLAAVFGANSSDRASYTQNTQASLPSSVTFSGLTAHTSGPLFGISAA